MCLCKYVVFTFSNTHAFKRLSWKLNEYGKLYPIGTIYNVTKNIENRDRLPYEELMAYAKLVPFEHIHFRGWEGLKQIERDFKDKDVFGKVVLQIH